MIIFQKKRFSGAFAVSFRVGNSIKNRDKQGMNLSIQFVSVTYKLVIMFINRYPFHEQERVDSIAENSGSMLDLPSLKLTYCSP